MESKSLTSKALDKGKSHSSSNTGMHAFRQGISPHGLVKGSYISIEQHANPLTTPSLGGQLMVAAAQSAAQESCVKGQQAEGQQDKSKAAPQLAAMATTWCKPMFAYSTVPPSFCGAAQASSLVPDDQARPEARSQTEPNPLEPARRP
ncbi:TPA: hypothetical protein ACH3X1_015609 [Trebouxia sp. C0004]